MSTDAKIIKNKVGLLKLAEMPPVSAFNYHRGARMNLADGYTKNRSGAQGLDCHMKLIER